MKEQRPFLARIGNPIQIKSCLGNKLTRIPARISLQDAEAGKHADQVPSAMAGLEGVGRVPELLTGCYGGSAPGLSRRPPFPGLGLCDFLVHVAYLRRCLAGPTFFMAPCRQGRVDSTLECPACGSVFVGESCPLLVCKLLRWI